MTATITRDRAATPLPLLARPRRHRPDARLYLLASIVISFLAGSSAPTPLYAIYQGQWGFSPITTTVVFGIYAMAVLAALLTLGKVSDHVGRRPVLFAALAAQIAAMIVFTTADGVPALMAARIVQGIATGAALGALGAGMLDVNRERGTFANAVSPGIGTALGALVSGVVVQYLPAPEHLIYLLLIVVFVLQGVGVAAMRETVTRKPGVLGTLAPEIRLPRALRGPMFTAVPVLFAVWALAGFYASLGPALTAQLIGSSSVVYGGLALFLLAGVAALATVVLRNVAARTVMITGIAALVVGVAITLVAISATSSPAFFVGTAVSGFGFGSGFQGGIRTVVPLAQPHERSGVLSLVYIASYLGMGAPAVGAGVLVVEVGGLETAAREYGIFAVALAVLALAGLLRRPRPNSHV
jgi:MFS family permease